MLRGRDVRRRPRADDGRRRASRSTQEPPWSPWRDTALVLLAEAHLLAGDLEQAATLFAETSGARRGTGKHRHDRARRVRARVAGDGPRRWADADEHLRVALATIDEHRMHDYAVSVLAFAAAARLALHRGDLRRRRTAQLARAMRARPSCTFVIPWLAVRLRLQLAKVYVAMARRDDGSPPAAGDRRHLPPPAGPGRPRRRGVGASGITSARATPSGAAGGPPLSPAELRLLPYLQTHLTFPEIAGRLFVSHNTVRSQVGSIYRKLGVSSRSDAVQHATAIGLLGG